MDPLLMALRFEIPDDDEVRFGNGDSALLQLADEARWMRRRKLFDRVRTVNARIQEASQFLVFGSEADRVDERIVPR